MSNLTENDISAIVFEAAKTVRDTLGPGLLESAYEACLCIELKKRGLNIDVQRELSISYDGQIIPSAYRLDIVVEDKVILELKAVEELLPIHAAQLRTYLVLSGKRLGMLINFNVPYMGSGIQRVVNGL